MLLKLLGDTMRTLQNIDAELSALNALLDELSTKRSSLEIYRHEARIYHNYRSGAYDSDRDFIS